MSLTLDIANELYRLSASENFTLAVARNLIPEELDPDGIEVDGDGPKRVKRELWRSGDQGLAADYEYVMYGKVSRRLEWCRNFLMGQIYKFDDSAQGDAQT